MLFVFLEFFFDELRTFYLSCLIGNNNMVIITTGTFMERIWRLLKKKLRITCLREIRELEQKQPNLMFI